MSFNLLRNSRVFFTTNVNALGVVQATGALATNTFEIQVQDDLSFGQTTESDTISLSEGGSAPVRGQRSFNTALNAADFSFSTYMRPADGGTNITAEESVLWNAMFSSVAIGGGSAAWVESAANATVTLANSNTHQLQKFGLVIVLDGATYALDNCAMDTATVDFSLESIASIQWAGKATAIRQLAATTIAGATLTGGFAGTVKAKNTAAPYIANKLSTLTIEDGINGAGTNNYTIAITGGSLTISNNLSYLIPANLGQVNTPVTYFTGVRSITGSLTAYLRAGALNSAGLLSNMLANAATDVDPKFLIQVEVGGAASATRVEFRMPAAVLSIPTIDPQQVVSTQINFTAQGYTGSNMDIGQSNELTITYVTPNA